VYTRIHDRDILSKKSAIAQRYEQESLLGKGTYGEVWKCKDTTLNRAVAVKVLHGGIKDFEQLKKEGQALSELTHKNIVVLYDMGSDEKNGWLVMELIDGPSLHEYLKDMIRQNTWLSFERAKDIVEQVLEALEFAHDKGRVHGDIKPANVFMPKTGEIKLGDFGVAKILASGGEIKREYSVGHERRLGSSTYAAPEVLNGQPRDFQSDLFSVGILAYVLFTGQHPFMHKSALLLIPELIKDGAFVPVLPSELNVNVPERYEKIVMRLLEKDRDKRYPKAREVLSEWRERIETVQCPTCNTENPVGNKFCGQCGIDLRAIREAESEPEKDLSTSFALFTAGKSQEAIILMQKSLAKNADFAKGWSHLGYMLNYERKYEEAEEACTKSIEIDPEPSRPYQTRGFARSNLGEFSEAIEDFTAALEREGDERRQSLIIYQRGYAKKLSGQFGEALKDADLALTLDKTSNKARVLKEQLQLLLKQSA